MALLWIDSFDHYLTADLTEKYVTASATITAAVGRRSTAGLVLGAGSSVVTPTLPVSGTTAILGVAVKPFSFATLAEPLQVRSGVTVQVTLAINTSGYLVAYRNTSAGTVLGTATTGQLSAGAYAYLELKAVIHPSAGSIIARVNELEVLNIPTANTAQSGVASWDTAAISKGVSGNNQCDDFYVLDGSGAGPCNALLGDCRVDARAPTAEGASSAWTPLSGTDNALMVDETTPDDDTTYTGTPTIGATDTHVVQDAPVAGATFYGAQLVISQKKTDAGTCAIAPVVRHGTTDYVGTATNPGTAYAYSVRPYGLNPGTSAGWTEADFNAAQFGYQRTA